MQAQIAASFEFAFGSNLHERRSEKQIARSKELLSSCLCEF